MNVLRKYTIESLKKNRGRTLVTIIGITLSMSLLTAVIAAVYSGQSWLADNEIANDGGWHGYYFDMDSETAKKVENTSEISEASFLEEIGWGEIGSSNAYKPYLLVEGFDDKLTDMLKINLVSGRIPENDSEILLPAHLYSNGNVEFKEGDQVTVSLGQRMSGDYNLSIDNMYLDGETDSEEIVNAVTMTYTVVGFYERLNNLIEPLTCPGYTAFTKTSSDSAAFNSDHRYSALFTVKRPGKIHSFFASADNVTEKYTYHRDLVIYYGASRSSSVIFFLYSFTAILILIIAFGSVALIYNSFAISISERMKQFGILKSIGASRKQIRNAVYFEALVLDAIAIPLGLLIGCLGIGTTLFMLRDSFSMVLGQLAGQVNEAVPISLKLNFKVLLLAALICVIMTLISAWIPGHKAVRLNAIESIRQSTTVTCKAKEVKTSGLVQRLFGFEGTLAVKNFKRDKKKYRTTILSLAASILLFVTSTTFCNYLNTSVSSVNGNNSDIDISVYYYEEDEGNFSVDEVLKKLKSVSGVDECVYECGVGTFISIKKDDLSDEFLSLPADYAGGDYNEAIDSYELYATLLFIDESAYRELLAKYKLSEEEYLNHEAPKAIAFSNMIDVYNSDDGKTTKYINFDYLKGKSDIRIRETVYEGAPEGYRYYGKMYDEEKGECLRFVEEEYYYDNDKAKEHEIDFAPEELEKTRELTIGFSTDKDEFYRPRKYVLQLVYPLSCKDQVTTTLTTQVMNERKSFAIKAKDYMGAEQGIESLIREEGLDAYQDNLAANKETSKRIVWIVTVFSFGFIILISLIAMANVFNTISTNIRLRKREFAMLKSTGMTNKAFGRMLNFECLYYGFRSIMLGFPVSILITYAIYLWISSELYTNFYIPWYSIVIAIFSVFFVVFMTMIYSSKKLEGENLIENLKSDTI